MQHWYTPITLKNEADQQAARILATLILTAWAAYLIIGLIAVYWGDWKLIAATLAGSVLQDRALGGCSDAASCAPAVWSLC